MIIAALLAVAFCAQAAKKPNVVVFFVDDMGYGEAGCYGSKDLRTPHIDSLAENGVRCTAGYKGWYAVRAGDWKLVYDDKEQATGLFNLAEDVGEKNNLIKSHPEKAAELEALWRKWNQKNAVPLWQTPTALEKMRKAYGNEGMATLK